MGISSLRSDVIIPVRSDRLFVRYRQVTWGEVVVVVVVEWGGGGEEEEGGVDSFHLLQCIH